MSCTCAGSNATSQAHTPNPPATFTAFTHSASASRLALFWGAVSALDFQRQRLAVRQPDDEVRDEAAPRAGPEIMHLKPEMIVLRIGEHVIALLSPAIRPDRTSLR